MRLVLAATLGLVAVAAGCRERPEASPTAPSASASANLAWDAGAGTPAAPKGMIWIPPGALVAGTPRDLLPRIADEEMAGEQVIMNGFFMSVYPYPNEEGAIPLASVTQAEAAALCAEQHKRLCTELEWERACKGPDNHVFEYGDKYRPSVCGTGAEPRMLPSGLRVGCVSDFGVRDLHGSLFEWTASAWGRQSESEHLVALRGGNGAVGDLLGRCANAVARSPDAKSPAIGFRCCSGAPNPAIVTVQVEKKKRLARVDRPDRDLLRTLSEAVRESDIDGMEKLTAFHGTYLWYWRPVGNEELVLVGGCSGITSRRRCGVAAARLGKDTPELLAWGSSGRYVPTLKTADERRDLWVYGGDDRSHFRRRIEYLWGKVGTGEVERNVKAGRR